MEKTELIYMDAKSSKFWNIECRDNEQIVTYGRIGTTGQTSSKTFPTAEKAIEASHKLIREKLAKGYVASASSAETQAGAELDPNGLLPLISFVSIKNREDISENTKTFIGRRVTDYDPDKPKASDGSVVYRFRSEWDEDVIEKHLLHFLESPASLEAAGIVIGAWFGDDTERTPEPIIEMLVQHRERLPKLAGIYVGDVVSEENEISWIYQTDLSPLLAAFPDLQLLRARGGNGLELKNAQHAKLRCLALEAGGLPVEVVRSVCSSDFPKLEHLELWLGTDEYGGTSTVQDLQPILSGERFPDLKYLGLRNCQYADDLAAVLVNSPVIELIETLDLSLGTLSDEGANALLSLTPGGSLKRINLHHHFISDAMVKKLKAMDFVIDASNPPQHDASDEELRFVAVGE